MGADRSRIGLAHGHGAPVLPGLKAGPEQNKAAKADSGFVPEGLMVTQPGPSAPGADHGPAEGAIPLIEM